MGTLEELSSSSVALRLDTKRQVFGVYMGTNSCFIDNQMLLRQRVVIKDGS